jgi:pantetheine-phosphate adenylyltransferase
MTIAIYPGSFDPLTNGHLDIIERALKTFDHVIIALSQNPQKKHTFALNHRVSLVKECIKYNKRVEVDIFCGLLVDYAKARNVNTILRGLRAVSDFEYEFQLANMNKKLFSNIETVFMMTGEASFYLSSRLILEIASFGSDVSNMVPAPVTIALKKHFGY